MNKTDQSIDETAGSITNDKERGSIFTEVLVAIAAAAAAATAAVAAMTMSDPKLPPASGD